MPRGRARDPRSPETIPPGPDLVRGRPGGAMAAGRGRLHGSRTRSRREPPRRTRRGRDNLLARQGAAMPGTPRTGPAARRRRGTRRLRGSPPDRGRRPGPAGLPDPRGRGIRAQAGTRPGQGSRQVRDSPVRGSLPDPVRPGPGRQERAGHRVRAPRPAAESPPGRTIRATAAADPARGHAGSQAVWAAGRETAGLAAGRSPGRRGIPAGRRERRTGRRRCPGTGGRTRSARSREAGSRPRRSRDRRRSRGSRRSRRETRYPAGTSPAQRSRLARGTSLVVAPAQAGSRPVRRIRRWPVPAPALDLGRRPAAGSRARTTPPGQGTERSRTAHRSPAARRRGPRRGAGRAGRRHRRRAG
jgi:hypothetical protein